jgi:hypothetical protein
MRTVYGILVLSLFASFAALAAVDPIPESQQAQLALKVLNSWRDGRKPGPPKKLHVVYYTPSDRDPEPDYRERLEAIMEDIRAFYRDGMTQAGFGPETFDLDRDAQGKWILYLVKGTSPDASFTTQKDRPGTGSDESGEKVKDECRQTLEAAGISYDKETVLIFCALANWDEKARTFRHHSPYFGSWDQTSGLCFAADTAILNVDDIPMKQPILDDQEYGKMSLGRFNTIFIGGIAHELGHAFALPHCGERWDEKSRGTSIMGAGNHTYRNERRDKSVGSFLTMASAMKLAARPLFSKWDLDLTTEGRLQTNQFHLSTNVSRPDLAGRKATLRVEGTVRGTPPIYGVIAYFDSTRNGGYNAPTATAVPDADGRYAIEVSDLAATDNGELRLEFCHANGAVSEVRTAFIVTEDGRVDLSEGEMREALEALGQFVAAGNDNFARDNLRLLEASAASEATKAIGRELVATLTNEPKPIPAEVPANVFRLALGDASPQSSEVGWLKPASNRLPPNNEIASPFLDSGKLFATGLFAHSPSRYVFDLGGKWKRLRGEGGLQTLEQPYAAGVVFVIKGDGKEMFRSRAIRGGAKADYDLNISGVKELELIVEKATSSNGNNWALWLDPALSR